MLLNYNVKYQIKILDLSTKKVMSKLEISCLDSPQFCPKFVKSKNINIEKTYFER